MIRGIKGIKDITPDEMPKWSVVERTAHTLAHAFGFQEIRIPVFERTDLFVHSIGGTTDIVEKEMYTFPDKDGTSLTLRPEGTAGVVRAFIERGLKTYEASRKLYYIGPMFRHERPQAGRLRQFHQFGVEYVGSSEPSADVEVITLLWRYFSALQLPGLSLELNSLGILADRQAYKQELVSFLKTKADGLCDNCRRRLEANPLRALDCKVPGCRDAHERCSVSDGFSFHFVQRTLRAGLAGVTSRSRSVFDQSPARQGAGLLFDDDLRGFLLRARGSKCDWGGRAIRWIV